MDPYKLNPDHSVELLPINGTESWLEWARQFENTDRIVDHTEYIPPLHIAGYPWLVSTIFLGLDHSYSHADPPLLFETMIFTPQTKKGRSDCYQVRYSTWDEAVAGHKVALTRLKAVLRWDRRLWRWLTRKPLPNLY